MMLNRSSGTYLPPPHRKQSRAARSTRSQFLPSHNISNFNRISTETLRGTTDNLQPQELHLRNRESCPNNRGHFLDDIQRTNAALKGISGKRLTYRRIGAQV